ncbi:TonB-dependent receptor [Flavobacterium pallidum]|uniref:TonB-dependent receptor n=1 Tax=Flavobacterium pallidum TaxID=2172098 RepID=A0A2S1SED1_9FLAO|nr:TonB-dependent receptor [Flavobacterium pallidum]AWI24776.1 TonB-dependent receptor [Flavobacterium pallidum]
MRISHLIITLLFCVTAFAQNKGTVSGTITDKDMNNETLPFASVTLKGTSIGSSTDIEGKYTLTAPEGTYTMVISFVGYETQEVAVTVKPNENIVVDRALGSGSVKLEDVVVTQNINREKEAVLLLEQKNATVIKQSIGAQELSRKGVSDVEEGLTKITGITKVGSRGLFVRGLEDRYNNLLINGLAVPSNNPFRKIIPLDLFPTDIVSAIDVYKTFNTDIYGDFSGGTFNIGTSKGGKSITKLSVGFGYTTDNNLSDFSMAADANGFKGFMGLTGKDRKLPGIFGNAPVKRPLGGQESLASFKSGFDVDTKTSPLNSSIGILHGEKFTLKNDAKMSYLFSLNFENSYKVREGLDRTVFGTSYEDTPTPTGQFDNNFTKKSFDYETNTSALIGLNYKTDAWDLGMNIFYLRNTVSSIQDQLGVSNAELQNPDHFFRTNQLDQSDYLTAQLTGKYNLTKDKNQTLKSGVSFTKTSYQQPDRKFLEGTREGDNLVMSYGGNDLLRQYFDISNDFYFSAMAEYALKFGKGEDKNQVFTFGYNGNASMSESSYRFVGSYDRGVGIFTLPLNNIDATVALDLANERFYFEESSNAQYRVKLMESTNAAYANILYHFGEKWELNAGLRGEMAMRETKFRRNGSFDQKFEKKTFDKFYALPSVNVKYALSDRANLRLATGITYTKPVQIEALAISYLNADGTSINGNPNLVNSDNYNVDFKYEIFPTSKEMFAVGVFGKKINNAIERNFQSTASGFITTYFNTGDATLYGAELEFIFDFARISKSLSDLSWGFNTSLMQTHVKANEYVVNNTEDAELVKSSETHRERDLQGASKWLVNTDLKYQFNLGKEWSNTVSAVYSVFGKRIFSVGSKPFDHIYELPLSKLDLVWSSKVNEHLDFKFSADNILNPKVKFELGENSNTNFVESSRILQDYKRGVGFSLGFSYTF